MQQHQDSLRSASCDPSSSCAIKRQNPSFNRDTGPARRLHKGPASTSSFVLDPPVRSVRSVHRCNAPKAAPLFPGICGAINLSKRILLADRPICHATSDLGQVQPHPAPLELSKHCAETDFSPPELTLIERRPAAVPNASQRICEQDRSSATELCCRSPSGSRSVSTQISDTLGGCIAVVTRCYRAPKVHAGFAVIYHHPVQLHIAPRSPARSGPTVPSLPLPQLPRVSPLASSLPLSLCQPRP